MVVKRETLIKARNQKLKDQWIPLKAVVATRTNPAQGRIAWVCGLWHHAVFPETEPGNHLSHGPQTDDQECPDTLGCPGERSAVKSRLLKLDDLSPDLPDLAQ